MSTLLIGQKIGLLAIACAGAFNLGFVGLYIGTARAQPDNSTKPLLSSSDVFELRSVADVRLSPNGSMIAYTVSTPDISTDMDQRKVWVVERNGQNHRPVSSSTGQQFDPRWSPDGKLLVFASRSKEGLWAIQTISAQGAISLVANLPARPASITWSPDGTELAFLNYVPRDGASTSSNLLRPTGAEWAPPVHATEDVLWATDEEGVLNPGAMVPFIIDVAGGVPRRATSEPIETRSPMNGITKLSWLPSGKALLMSGYRANSEIRPWQTDIFSIWLPDGTVRQMTDRIGPDEEAVASPDGSYLAFVGYTRTKRAYENTELYLMNEVTGSIRSLTPYLDRSVSKPIWSTDGKSIFVAASDRGHAKVLEVSLDGKIRDVATDVFSTIGDRPYITIDEFSISNDGYVGYVGGVAGLPAEARIAKIGNPKSTRAVTDVNSELLARRTIAIPQPLKVRSLVDGEPIDAWLMLPPNLEPSEKAPLILEIHGGPYVAAYGPHFSWRYQQFLSRGYAVVFANQRGSGSYGARFANLDGLDYPKYDHDDLMGVVDAAIAKGRIDEDRLFISGTSGGGLHTLFAIGKTNRFRAAAAEKPVVNWLSEVLSTDRYGEMFQRWFGPTPWEDALIYWKRSPVSYAPKIQTPTLLIGGLTDRRVLISEAEQMYNALKLHKVPARLVRVPGANHSAPYRPSYRVVLTDEILSWFDRHSETPKGAADVADRP